MATSRVRWAAVCAIAGLSLLEDGAARTVSKKARPCPAGRFLLPAEVRLLTTPQTASGSIGVVAPSIVSVPGCSALPTRMRVVARKKATQVVAAWGRCGTARKVVLRGRIATDTCDRLTGTLKVKGAPAQRFEATRSGCGDGRLDGGGGETCDASAPGGDAACPGRCSGTAVEPPCSCTPPTTTTVPPGGPTTTTNPGSGTTTTTTTSSSTTTSLAPSGCASTYAGCTSFADRTAAGADRTIGFECCAYSPQCIRVRAGQSVKFSGTFREHPLRGASCGGGQIADTDAGASASFRLTRLGVHGFFCLAHGLDDGSFMAGAIEVVP